MHVGGWSNLGPIINRCGNLPAAEAQDGEPIERGRIYVAPSNNHLIIGDGKVFLSRGPRENRHRPAVDPLFRSAARTYRERVIGVILTGALDDGAAGTFAIKNRGGLAVVQDPADALAPGMPLSAMRNVEVDHCVPLDEIAPLLAKLARTKALSKHGNKNDNNNHNEKKEAAMAKEKKPGFRDDAVSFVCPECSGPLYEEKAGRLVKFNCQIGHSFSPESLTEAHSEALERALWIAIRTLNERIAIHEALMREHEAKKNFDLARRMEETAKSASDDVTMIREILDRI